LRGRFTFDVEVNLKRSRSIFDFDGVIADSEALANTVLAEAVSLLGLSTTLDDALTRYIGKHDVVAIVEALAADQNHPHPKPGLGR
jgi:beta-phosphoglucomutase-like phosphatase (HAD superfamily)